MDAFRPWVLKDPRMSLLLPGWLPTLEVPIAVIMYRDPTEIALSLHKRDGLPAEYAMALWEYYSVTLLNASVKLPRIHIRHADLMAAPVKTTEFLFDQLKLAGTRRIELPTEKEIRAFIDPRLHRARASRPAPLQPHQQLLCEILQGREPQTTLLKMSDHTKSLIQQGPTLTA
jgi:hypothetical protein